MRPSARLAQLLLPVVVSVPIIGAPAAIQPAQEPARDTVLAAMKRATRFMTERASCRGGYVWTYLPDFSRRWGELEARPSMIWIQGPGTPAMGTRFLEAWEATGDEQFCEAARQAGDALIAGQLACGGWNYLVDFAGETSLRDWYATVGRHAWRLEEFHHYFGNATFDDEVTVSAARFLLKLYLARRDTAVKAALDRTVGFILESQHPVGAWPQRHPPVNAPGASETARYSSFLTFNDDVSAANIAFLAEYQSLLGDPRIPAAIARAMGAFVELQQPAPQAGWAMQYSPENLEPAGARSYEPAALVTHATANNIDQLLRFHAMTGDPRFLERIPEALEWLDACRLPPEPGRRGTHPTFVELGTGRPLYLHREGSNAINGRYFTNDNPASTVGHYSSFRSIDVARLRERYEAACHGPHPKTAMPASAPDEPKAGPVTTPAASEVARIVAALDAEGRWLSPLRVTSHPYREGGSTAPEPGDYSGTYVGDSTDTSPFGTTEPGECISTKTYLRNMATLLAWLQATKAR